MTPVITKTSFPTPHLALRSTSADRIRLVSAFAVRQAAEAEHLRKRLERDLRDLPFPLVRTELLRTAHAETWAWRYSLALTKPDSRGTGLEAGRVLLSLEQGGPNADRLGYVGRHRHGATWNEHHRLYEGGTSTPAHDILLHHGRLAERRFAEQKVAGDVLRNRVHLPDGRLIEGNRLVRGRVAARIAETLAARRAARGRDVSRMETGGQPIYAVTGPTRSRATCWSAGMTVLGTAEEGDIDAWATAAYLLYQGIRHKRGSDATLRVFLVAAGAVLLDEAPVLPHDLDLQCMVLDQATATANLTSAQLNTYAH
ncbi:hypothetical protein ACFXGA_27015 [Actinosynnema sp. NPDC059335]|uniref:hypothetical protein n=1 Tax=Actinosynnema sp. NPDC059335 TaxID=3346804 RepID=UPI00366E2E09